jgi:DNA-binding transcriptional MocR family regulator
VTIWVPEAFENASPNLADQIVRAIAADIERGKLSPGARLPTHRDLADALGVAIGTVTRAYAIAKERGLLASAVGRGSFIAAPAETAIESDTIDLSQNYLRGDHVSSMLAKGLADCGNVKRVSRLMDTDQLAAGPVEHRTIAAKWLNVPPEQLVITNGAQHAMSAALMLCAKRGDTIVTEDVTYAGVKAIASLLHVRLVGVRMDQNGIDPADLDRVCQKRAAVLYTTPTLHNPTGTTMPLERRIEIANLARAHDLVLIEDDVYGFAQPDSPPPIATFAPERTFYITGTSKSLVPGLRIGYAVCPPNMVEQFTAAVRSTIWGTSPILTDLVSRWIENGVADSIVEWKRREVRDRFELASQILGTHITQERPCPHVWLSLPDSWRIDRFVSEASRRDVLVSPANAFAVTHRVPQAIRICIGAARSRERLSTGLQKLANLLATPPRNAFDFV